MANSEYEYVKQFEVNDKLPPCNWIILRINGCQFKRFSEDHTFEKPNDENALNLMNACAVSMLEHFPDVVFAYGFSDEYSFLLKDTTQFYQRRASKIISLLVSFFTSMYVMKWKEFFPHNNLRGPPYFDGRVVCYPRVNIIQDYFMWRQADCHTNNQYNTCFWMLVKSGKTEKEVHEFLKGTQSKHKNELLFQEFGVNYDKLPPIFKKGSCVYREKVEETVKLDARGNPIRRTRNKVVVGHFDVGPKFWSEQPYILKEQQSFGQDTHFSRTTRERGESSISKEVRFGGMANNSCEYVKKFEVDDRLPPCNWIILRIDGCHFHQFSADHTFEKPNDENALNLMNACSVSMLEHFPDFLFAYGVSDEYSFLLKETSQLYQRSASKIISHCVSYFTSMYMMKWKEFFPCKDLRGPPYFDGRVVCYPRACIIQDYFAWRQVDCHINNQYNTCFWMLVKSGKTKKEAQEFLKVLES